MFLLQRDVKKALVEITLERDEDHSLSISISQSRHGRWVR